MLASLSLIDQEKKKKRLANVGASASCSLRKKKKGKEKKKKAEEILRVRFWNGGHLSSSESGRVPTVEDLASKFSRGFNPPTDCLEVGLKQSLERRKKFASGLDLFAHRWKKRIEGRGVGAKPRSRSSDVF